MKENRLLQLSGTDNLLIFLIYGRNAGYQGLSEEAINLPRPRRSHPTRSLGD